MKREKTTVSEKIDAKLVKELREKSGAPMGDCLKAPPAVACAVMKANFPYRVAHPTPQ